MAMEGQTQRWILTDTQKAGKAGSHSGLSPTLPYGLTVTISAQSQEHLPEAGRLQRLGKEGPSHPF